MRHHPHDVTPWNSCDRRRYLWPPLVHHVRGPHQRQRERCLLACIAGWLRSLFQRTSLIHKGEERRLRTLLGAQLSTQRVRRALNGGAALDGAAQEQPKS